MEVSLCENLTKSKITGYDTINGILDKIRKGEKEDLVEHARSLARSHGKHSPEYKEIKAQNPTFTPNASFSLRRDLKYLEEPSGFIYIDLDDYSDINFLNQDINFLKKDEYIYSCWRSLSGIGVGALVKVNGITAQNFKDCWSYLSNYFKSYGMIVDPQTNDITRQNVISYDPDIYINENSTSLYADQITTQTCTSIPQFQDSKESALSGLFYGFEETSLTDSSRIIYRTILDDYQGMDYVIIEDGKESRSCYLPKEIRAGSRHLWIVGYTISILFNNPAIPKKRLYSIVSYANKTHCLPPLPIPEIMSIVNWYYNKHIKGKLDYHPKIKKIWFDPDSNLSKHDKKKIIGKESGKLRRKSTFQKLKGVYTELSLINDKVTQKMVSNASKISTRTIKKYWDDIRE